MSIIAKAKALGLPLDSFVVIGSGLLDAYGLREANDIDIVVSEADFEKLKQSGDYRIERKYAVDFLAKNDLEIWTSWGQGYDFEKLNQKPEIIDGVRFANPDVIIYFKEQRYSEKDWKDIALLKEYLDGRK